jgi:hypothetical protein
VFRRWYGDGLLEHYFNERAGELPLRRDLASVHSVDCPVGVYGHFNRLRGFGIEEYYPEVRQFVTIMRDPFESAISNYFFLRKSGSDWIDQSRVPTADLRNFLSKTPPNILNHFPREVTRDNYREQIDEFFVEIGNTESLESSLRRISYKLGMPFESDWLPFVNSTERDQPHPEDMRDEYAEHYPLEFEVYRYVSSLYESP